MRGQLCLFMNASYASVDSNDHATTPLIHHHFAGLYTCAELQEPLVVNSTMMLLANQQKWKPISRFPPLDEDLLLYLSMMGLPGKPALFCSTKMRTNVPVQRNVWSYIVTDNQEIERQSFSQATRDFLQSDLYRKCMLDTSNLEQPTNDGMLLEAITAGAVCLASHCNGFTGCSVIDFMEALIWELSDCRISGQHLKCFEQVTCLDSIHVPFLPPPNQEWPADLKIEGASFGTLCRTTNKSQIDFMIEDACITGECKNRTSRLDLAEMTKVLKNIRSQSKLHLVITNALQEQYYDAETFAQEFPPGSVAAECAFWQFSPNDLVKQVSGLISATSPKRIVLFIQAAAQRTAASLPAAAGSTRSTVNA